MTRRKAIVVTKRDGTLERFEATKLTNTLSQAMQANQYDEKLAVPLCRAVEMHLYECVGPRPPSTNYIHRCACAVLRQTGLTDVADLLNTQRRMRTLRRQRVRVLDDRTVPTTELRWRKALVVDLLHARYTLRHRIARFIAGQVEWQVFALEYRVIRQSFLLELIQHELLAWGLSEGLDTTAERQVRLPVQVPGPEQNN